MKIATILFVIACTVATLHAWRLRLKKQELIESKVKTTFNAIFDVLVPLDNDDEWVQERKRMITARLAVSNKMFSDSPLVFAESDVHALEQLLRETQNEISLHSSQHVKWRSRRPAKDETGIATCSAFSSHSCETARLGTG